MNYTIETNSFCCDVSKTKILDNGHRYNYNLDDRLIYKIEKAIKNQSIITVEYKDGKKKTGYIKAVKPKSNSHFFKNNKWQSWLFLYIEGVRGHFNDSNIADVKIKTNERG